MRLGQSRRYLRSLSYLRYFAGSWNFNRSQWDIENQHAIRFFETFVKVHSMFEDAVPRLETFPDVERVSTRISHRIDETPWNRMMDTCLYVELQDGASLDWFLELSWYGVWAIEENVNKHDAGEDGSHSIIQLPEVGTENLDEAIDALLQIGTAPGATVDSVMNSFRH